MAEEKKVVKKAAPKKAAPKKAAPKKAAPKKAVVKKNTVSVTLVKSFHGRLPTHRATITGLGLKRINHTVVLVDTPEVRGMINKVSYLLKVEG
jgi:large subunit ribosomal protein L30